MDPHPPLELLPATRRAQQGHQAHDQAHHPLHHPMSLQQQAHLHDQARLHAQALRREAQAWFWQQVFNAVAAAWAGWRGAATAALADLHTRRKRSAPPARRALEL